MDKIIPLVSMFMLFVVGVFAQIEVDAPPPPPPPVVSEDIFMVVEEMPYFPGCREIENISEKRKCADEKLLSFVYENLEYPKLAKDNKVEGKVVVQFVVEKDGTLKGAKIIRDIGANCGKAGLAVIEKMNETGILWEPGKQRGTAKAVQFNLPIMFKL